jgi:arylsulfatase A-like enzyme
MARRARQPNIVMVTLDDLGSADLGCYGQTKIRTPHIDALARQGTRYTQCYAGAPVCAPSRAVLMTGMHGGHAAIRANAGTVALEPQDVTVATLLQREGYVCGGFGKWGLGDAHSTGSPGKHGFDRFFGYLHQVHAHSYYPEFLWDCTAKGDRRVDTGGGYSADLIAERTLEWVKENAARPFFLHASWTLPHGKFEIPDVGEYAKEEWTQGQKVYAAMVTKADSHVGRLVKLLDELGLASDTLLLVTSDNGGQAGEDHGYSFFESNGTLRGAKGSVYEGGIRVPMIARWPKRVKAGATHAGVWSFCDFLPTALEVAGSRRKVDVDGVSVAGMLTGGRVPRREYLYWEQNSFDIPKQVFRGEQLQQAVRFGNWKAVRVRPGAAVELYDLGADATETKDLAGLRPMELERGVKYLDTARTAPRPHLGGAGKWATA